MNHLIESFSGIRGVFGQTLTEELVRKYAFGFGNWVANKLGKPAIVIGYDTRPSSKMIKKVMVETLASLGCKIIDLGLAPTPAISFGTREFGSEAGIIITASHNEPEWNGWKFLWRDGGVLRPDQIKEVIEAVHQTRLPFAFVADKVFLKPKFEVIDKHRDLLKKYVNFVLNLLGKENVQAIKKAKLKIVVDPNGGTAAVVIKQILDALGVEGIYLNMKLGKFEHLIEPKEESLAYLSDIIKKERADFGAGWDCDADRCEIVLGEKFLDSYVLSGHYLLALLVDSVLGDLKEEAKGKIVVTNDATSNLVRRTAKKFGAEVKEVEVGEINVVAEMYNLGSPVGGEGSSAGGIFPPQRTRDGMLTLAMILKLIAKQGQSLVKILEGYPKYYTKATKIECDPRKQVEMRRKLEEYFEEQGFSAQKTGDQTGGLKIILLPDSFIFFRASKTEPGIFRIIADSPERIETERLLKIGIGAFENIKRRL